MTLFLTKKGKKIYEKLFCACVCARYNQTLTLVSNLPFPSNASEC